MITRRGFLGAILAAGVAPAVVKAGNLMPVRPVGGLILPGDEIFRCTERYAIGHVDPAYFARSMLETKERVAFEILQKHWANR